MNKMQEVVRIEKITLNVGVGKEQNLLDKAIILLKHILPGSKPVKTTTNKRIQGWGLRPGLAIGCKITLRGERAVEMLKRLLYAKDNALKAKSFDFSGNLSFGVHEYIDIKDIKYEPNLGIMGLEVAVTLERKGYRVKRRSLRQTKVGKNQIVTRPQAMEFMKSQFAVEIIGE